MASISMPGGRTLHLMKNKGLSFVQGVDQNFFPIFHWQSTPLTKLIFCTVWTKSVGHFGEGGSGGRNKKGRRECRGKGG